MDAGYCIDGFLTLWYMKGTLVIPKQPEDTQLQQERERHLQQIQRMKWREVEAGLNSLVRTLHNTIRTPAR